MKSRSHRQPISEPRNDDWVNGSWTVDCICGVNFDDGEEMVDCDECGVWVHTRCVRFVKGEKSFSCDKCKNRNNSGIGNDSEETEVAEVLVELPTKTLAMDNPIVSHSQDHRLWTNIPMEERVHVHGVPGGDPGLFSESKMSSVFGPLLWRCSGYVPKKFSSKYNEFPWCGNGEVKENGDGHSNNKGGDGEEDAKNGNDGAGLLLSFSNKEKNNCGIDSIEKYDVAKSPLEGDVLVSLRKLNGEKVSSRCIRDGVTESSTVKPKHTMLPSIKHKELSMSKVQTEMKRVRVSEEEDADQRLPGHASNAVLASTFSSDAKQLEFSQARGPTTVNDDVYCSDVLGECATNLALTDRAPEATVGKDISNDDKSNMTSKVDRALVGSGSFTNTDDDSATLSGLAASQCEAVKEEVQEDSLHHHHDCGETAINVTTQLKEPPALDAKDNSNGQDLNIDEADSGPNKKLKDVIVGTHEGYQKKSFPVHCVKADSPKLLSQHPKSHAELLSVETKMIETSLASQPKMNEANKNLSVETSSNYRFDVVHGHAHLPKQTDGTESGIGARKKSYVLKNNTEISDSVSKPDIKVSSHSTTSHQGKGVACVGRHTSISSGNASKFHNNHVTSFVRNPFTDKQKESSKNSGGTMKDSSSSYNVKDDEKYERRKKLVKESSRLNPVSKTSSSTKPQISDANPLPSEVKDSTVSSTSKVILSAKSPAAPRSGDRATSVHIDSATNSQSKAGLVGSALTGSGGKSHHSDSHPIAKGNVASNLSDEALAFLLHQELNSSPRVPRVPRMRHAGSLPQITSPNSSSTLMKRASSSGHKDISMTSRRRSKDLSRERSRGRHDADVNLKRKHVSSEKRRREGGSSVDSLSKRDTDSRGIGRSMQYKKSSSMSSSGDLTNGHNLTSRRSSRSTSDYDSSNRRRTLPDLIAEIMSDGKRMTLEELCNAVLPHWPHLRKHNGERYAYSSHSQAVLDCLRNRSEWARLVDRGPKTSSSRKRRKDHTYSLSNDSDDSSEEHIRTTKKSKAGSFDSQTKGKRSTKTRQGRRLAFQGSSRGLVQRRRRAEVVSDDDESDSFSDSSSEEQSLSSDDEIQGGGASTAGNEATSSSSGETQ